jgi:hypothetical protein
MRQTFTDRRFTEISPQHFAWCIQIQLHGIRPDANYPGVNFLGSEIPLEMFAFSEAEMKRAVMLATPKALGLAVSQLTHQISGDKHDGVVEVVLLFRDALTEMFAEDGRDWQTESLGTFAQRVLNKADAIHSVRQCFADATSRTSYGS